MSGPTLTKARQNRHLISMLDMGFRPSGMWQTFVLHSGQTPRSWSRIAMTIRGRRIVTSLRRHGAVVGPIMVSTLTRDYPVASVRQCDVPDSLFVVQLDDIHFASSPNSFVSQSPTIAPATALSRFNGFNKDLVVRLHQSHSL